MRIPSITMLYEKTKKVNEIRGSSLLPPAHGRVGARATSLSFCILVPPPSEKIAGGFQQAGKKEGGLSVIPTRNFCPPTKKAKPRRPARSEQSPAKKFSFPFRKKSRAKSKNAKKTFLRGGER